MADTSLVFNIIAKDKTAGVFEKVKGAASAMFAMGAAAAGAFAMKAISSASDLAETQSKVNTIFGNSAGIIDDFASKAAVGLGQSKQEALDAASTFAIFGQGAGLTGDKLAGFSTQMTGLASDMASFSNTSPQEAIEAIGAALRGEADPIEKYGVLLNDATLRQAALKLGLTKTTKEALTPQQRVLAAQKVIMDQTKLAHGDFARTSSGLANQQRIMKAELSNVTAEMGQKLLPAALKVTHWAVGAIDWMKQHGTLVKVIVGVLGALAVVFGVLTVAMKIQTVVQWAMNAAWLANPVTWIIIGIVALIAVIVWIALKTTWFQTIWKVVWGAIKAAAAATWNWLKSAGAATWHAITSAFGAVGRFFSDTWHSITSGASAGWKKITNGFNTLIGFFKGIPKRISSATSGMWDGIKNAFKSAINWLIRKWNGLHLSIPSIDTHIPGIGRIGGFSLYTSSIPYLAKGGTITSAGSAVVGERGPELLNLPGGARVTPLTSSQKWGGRTVIEIRSGGSRFDDMLVEILRDAIQARGGDVQTALGR